MWDKMKTAAKLVGAALTLVSLGFGWYKYSTYMSTQLSDNIELLNAQKYLRGKSNSGTEYDISMLNDDNFALNLRFLLNFYERTAWQARFWIVIKPIYDENIVCSIVKHSAIFLNGKSYPGMWTVSGGPFTPGYEITKSYAASIEQDSKDCEQYWKRDWELSHPKNP